MACQICAMAPKPAKQKHMRLQSYGFEVLPGPAGLPDPPAANQPLQQDSVGSRTAELEALGQVLDAIASSVSHDLRAPIHSIDGFSHALRQTLGDGIPERAAHYLDRITNSVRQMNVMVDGLLVLAKATRGEMRREKLDMSAMACETLARLAAGEPDRLVMVDVQQGMAADGDARLVRLVLEHLLGNAWKFSAGAHPAHIAFTFASGVFCVKDNGAGFDMDYVERLFQPFHRLHTSTEFPGNGMGLATVQAIVTRHGGSIRAESGPGRGARFCFTLGS